MYDRIKEFFITKTSDDKSKDFASKNDIKVIIKLLDEENQVNPFVDSKILGEVQSYDLLMNDKYGRLSNLKELLERAKIDWDVKTGGIDLVVKWF